MLSYEVGLDYHEYGIEDKGFYRPVEVDLLIGDASKAKEKLGWKRTYTFQDLVSEMVNSDLRSLSARHFA
ncbi:MAG: GDP-mannose 4,6-dehydratase [Pyrinomonadaceae bacterium]